MAAVATILVVGLVVAVRSGALTGDSGSPAAEPRAKATERVTTPTSTAAAASTVPAVVNCPVLDDVCRLALEFLPAVESADGSAIAARAVPQRFECSHSIPVWDHRFTAAQLGLCPDAGSPLSVDAYEFHTGKGPGYFTSRAEFADQVSGSLRGYGEQATSQPRFRIVAVGCGAEGERQAPDCSRGGAAVYAVSGPDSGFGIGPWMVVLVFARPNETGSWAVQKYWQPYQGGFPPPVVDGMRTQIFDGGGVQHLELHPYDGR